MRGFRLLPGKLFNLLLLENSSAEEGVAVVESDDLSGRDAALHVLIGDVGAAVAVGRKGDGRGGIAVADADEHFAFFGQRTVNPGEVVDPGFRRVERSRRFRMVKSYDQLIGFKALGDDDVVFVVGIGRDIDAAALADGVMEKPFVFAEYLSGSVYDFSRFLRDVLLEKIVDADFADEANALAVLAFGVRESGFFREFAEFRLEQMADRIEGALQLLLAQQSEKIGLVLVRIDAAENVGSAVGVVAAAGVVTGGDAIKTVCESLAGEDAKLHFPIAENVRIRRQAVPIAFDQILHDVLAVVFD